jgi:hypothetical protein
VPGIYLLPASNATVAWVKSHRCDLRSEQLFKAVLKAQSWRLFSEAANLQLYARPSGAAVEQRHARYEGAISPMYV